MRPEWEEDMEQCMRRPLSVLESYPVADQEEIHRLYLEERKDFDRKIVVLDDDPTGVQTVHGVYVYTDWSPENLLEGMEEENQMFFLLTNSRSFSPEKTEEVHRALARRTVEAARQTGKELLLVARGDSTLRGHYLLEPRVLRETLEEETGRKVHGLVICPFFCEGGRYTMEGVHYVREGEYLVPAGQTEFAADSTFGYQSSHLGEYVEEKSGGFYRKESCIHITMPYLRGKKYEEITSMLMAAEDFCPICVDAIAESDVEAFAICLLRAIKAGKEFVIRSAAAMPRVLGNVGSRPLLTRQELLGGAGEDACQGENAQMYGGLVLAGSHVKKTTAQLESLKKSRVPAEFVEFRVNACFEPGGLEKETELVIERAEEIMGQGRTAVVYTSRRLLAPEGMTGEELLNLSVKISDAVTGVAAGLHRQPRFLIAKGGITSSDVGTRGLGVRKAMVAGQAAPGIPVWKTGPESRFPGLSYIIFPGNVGEEDSLRKMVEMLA